ncbi:MAG: 50S ribosomal protein L9 [Candidatus Vogelbacteria bacterium RIFOXYD1_FULL_46_19]|jgi:large subunit ribosomal protein L9|uniref:Large ribosomal subunit protein bL9 n=1 Tax=Candidatus Vogelbacteria bacterium RIFOXYD1_FULL_46_19 TaxID=1802439 RepID=A0A1G2QFS2_9BACT|nr:MAG: 50S ribosomal protein L9 [Candidatus Vogelbacteria bacterium RIFOXYD1_FULL_46_19]
MKVVLMQDVAKLGKKYEEKEVAAGYARNFLLPRGKAVMPGIMPEAKLTNLREKHLAGFSKQKEALKLAIEALPTKSISLMAKANEEGHLFAGVGKGDIAEALKAQYNLDVDLELIHLGKALKTTGIHEVEIGEGSKVEVIIEAES